MKHTISIIILSLCSLLTSCTVHPSIYNAQTGEFTTLGGSIGTKSKTETASAVSPSGTSITYVIEGKDETLVPKYYFMERAVEGIATNISNAYKTSQATTRAAGVQTTRRAAINADKAVRLQALKAEAAAAKAAEPIVVPNVGWQIPLPQQ